LHPPTRAHKAEIEALDSGTETNENNHMVVRYCALMMLIGGVQMLTLVFSMNFQWPQSITHAFESAIGPIVFFNFIGAWIYMHARAIR
jgi:hypothetical protein